MKISAVSYPYPVLGNENDVAGTFDVTKFIRTSDPNQTRFDFEYDISNSSIDKMISEGRATFMAQVECSNTFYRKAFPSYEKSGSFQLGTNELREKVFVRFYICATTDIPNYTVEGSHPDYAGFEFYVENGDVLAVGPITSFIAEKSFDPLRAPVASLFRIKPGKNATEAQPEFDAEKITIVLPEEDYKLYQGAVGRKMHDNIHASVVYPVLVEAINLMKHESSEYEQYNWFDRINQICIDNGYDVEDPLSAAQKILSNPVGRNFKQLEDTFSSFDGADE
jgi:hypothetical protein